MIILHSLGTIIRHSYIFCFFPYIIYPSTLYVKPIPLFVFFRNFLKSSFLKPFLFFWVVEGLKQPYLYTTRPPPPLYQYINTILYIVYIHYVIVLYLHFADIVNHFMVAIYKKWLFCEIAITNSIIVDHFLLIVNLSTFFSLQ